MSCPDINRQGMQKTKNIPTYPDKDRWKWNKINIEGIVDSVGVDTFFVDKKYIVHYMGDPPNVGKIIKVKNVNLTGSDNDMKLVFDSNAVFVPLDLNLVKGDSIFITDYSATFFLECYTHVNLHGEFIGFFSVNERPPTDELFCYEIEDENFAKVSSSEFNNISQYYFNGSSEFAPSSTRDADGIVEKIDTSKAVLYDVYGNKTPISVMTYDNHQITVTKKILLTNSQTVYIPYSMNANVGDSVYAKNYIAIFNDTCLASNLDQQIALVQGSFTIIPQKSSASIKKGPLSNKERSKSRNRDACGKYTPRPQKKTDNPFLGCYILVISISGRINFKERATGLAP